jgi:hypothetical protein
VSFICDAIEHVEREHYISQMAGQLPRWASHYGL